MTPPAWNRRNRSCRAFTTARMPIARRKAPDAVVIATAWGQFRALDLARLKRVMAQPVIVDLRNIYRTDEMKRAAFRHVPIGRTELSSDAPLAARNWGVFERGGDCLPR